MAGSMSKADLIADLRGMLDKSADKFALDGDAPWERHLTLAALDLGRFRRRTLADTLTLVADQANYAAPAALLNFKVTTWGDKARRTRKPWDANWPGPPPRVSVAEAGDGSLELWLDPAPTAAQISDLGGAFAYFFWAGHVIGDTAAQTSVRPGDRHLLLMRAMGAALTELANKGVMTPVRLGDGVGAMPKNGTPAALADQAIKLFETMARAA